MRFFAVIGGSLRSAPAPPHPSRTSRGVPRTPVSSRPPAPPDGPREIMPPEASPQGEIQGDRTPVEARPLCRAPSARDGEADRTVAEHPVRMGEQWLGPDGTDERVVDEARDEGAEGRAGAP